MFPQTILEKIPAIEQHRWKKVGERSSNSVLNRDLYLKGWGKQYMHDALDIDFSVENFCFLNPALFLEMNEFDAFVEKVEAKLKDDSYLPLIVERYAAACETFRQFSERLIKQKEIAEKELPVLFEEGIEAFLALGPFVYFTHDEERIPASILNNLLEQKGIPQEKWNPLRAELIVSPRKTLLQQEAEELLLLKTKDEDAIVAHIKKYPWIRCKYFTVKEVSIEETISRIKNVKPPKKEKRSTPLQLTNHEQEIVDLLGELLYLKTYRKELISMFTYAMGNVISMIAEKQQLTYQECINQTTNEIKEFFAAGKVYRKDIKERLDGFAHLCVNAKVHIISGENFVEVQEKTDVVKGATGYKGKVVGEALVVQDEAELEDVTGKIVVIDSLSPSGTQALPGIKGLITNHGGMLSHAVIIAREEQIPCLIGTKNATASFKTGDMIALDADKGVAKKLPTFRKMFGITMGLCRADLYMPTHVHNTADVLGKGHDSIVFTIKDGKNTGYFSEEVITAMGSLGLKKLQDPDFVQKNQTEVDDECASLWDYCETLRAKQLKHIQDGELLDSYTNLFHRIQKLFGYFNVSQPSISFALEKEIGERLERHKLSAEDQQAILEVFLKADRTTMIEDEEIALLKIALAKGKGLLRHQHRYSFLASSENFDEFDLEYFKKRLDVLMQKSEKELHASLSEKIPDPVFLGKEREQIAQKYALPHEITRLLDVARIYSHQRMMIRTYWTKAVNLWGKMLREFARRMGLSEVEIQYVLKDEIEAWFEGTPIDENEIKDRMKFCIFAILDKESPTLLTGEEARDFFEACLAEKPVASDQVTGTPASPGVIKGKVKVLAYGENMVKQIEEMEQGDILVTGNTRPDMIMALKKASAVVTDEGGICSHAALVSREFGIPCVVGTKDATEIFKDGDIIEVDAHKGVARKV